MTDRTPVHIRAEGTAWQARAIGLCGQEAPESISRRHLAEHVLDNRDGCCTALWGRLCAACYETLGVVAPAPTAAQLEHDRVKCPDGKHEWSQTPERGSPCDCGAKQWPFGPRC